MKDTNGNKERKPRNALSGGKITFLDLSTLASKPLKANRSSVHQAVCGSRKDRKSSKFESDDKYRLDNPRLFSKLPTLFPIMPCSWRHAIAAWPFFLVLKLT